MSDSSSSEKTEDPTDERLRKLRQDGNVPKSKDIVAAVSMLGVSAVLGLTFAFMTEQLMACVHRTIALITDHSQPFGILSARLLFDGILVMGKVVAAPLALDVFIGIAANIAQVGFLFSMKPITPDFNKINPFTGFKNLINMKKLVELLKTIVKFLVISYFSYIALKHAIRDVVLIIRSDLFIGVKIVGSILWDFISKISMLFIVIAAFDLFYQRKRYTKDNRMSKHDVKQEYKQSEGDPQQKADRKRLHQEILNSGGGKAVKGADVVVRNPEHIAVALKYDQNKKDAAPVVVAKGERLWALKIIDAAQEYGIPVVRNVPLAQALNKLQLGDEIPEELYQAVAEVLTFVYALTQEQKQKLPHKKT